MNHGYGEIILDPAFTVYKHYEYICHNNTCAAALIPFFRHFHTELKKVKTDDVLQEHTIYDFGTYCGRFFGKGTIGVAIEKLDSLGIISLQKFDQKTNEYQIIFNPEVVARLVYDEFETTDPVI